MIRDDRILTGKRILLFIPVFFGYESIIKKSMEMMGALVDFYDERSIKSNFSKALLKINPALFKRKSEKYFNKIITEHKNTSFDYIIIIKCDMISERILDKLRNEHPEAKLCLHLWDSVKNIPNIKKKIPYFDCITSFDRNDCIARKELRFRPLFFSSLVLEHKESNYLYDIAFCGTIHSDRYCVIKKIEKLSDDLKLKFYKFAYIQSRFVYYFYRFSNKCFKNSTPQDFSFIKKPQEELYAIEMSSRIILDIQHPKQSGLTIRTIEMLGMKKKLITTNTDIINYDFYDPSNICIIDRNNPKLDQEFLTVPYKDLAESIYDNYYINQWILDVLGIGEIAL